jgi:hypothetical protein
MASGTKKAIHRFTPPDSVRMELPPVPSGTVVSEGRPPVERRLPPGSPRPVILQLPVGPPTMNILSAPPLAWMLLGDVDLPAPSQ